MTFTPPRTPKQRAAHLETLKNIVKEAGFHQDSYGNWLLPDRKNLRIKFKDVNVRFERKIMDRWVSTGSYVISKFDPDQFKRRVEIAARV